jgi:hypothetical protein
VSPLAQGLRRAAAHVGRGELAPVARRVRARARGEAYGHLALVVSSGRCGTQWLAATLGRLYPDLAVVQHEPVGTAYNSRRFLGDLEPGDAVIGAPAVAAHLERVEATLRDADYIETGSPLYGVVPYFLRRFPGRVRLVHLVRHPVPTALSIATHDRFSRSGKEAAWMEAAMLDPWVPGVRQADYRQRWEAMTDYEKSLFFWTEVNLLADDLARRFPEVPFLRVRFEDLFGPGPAVDEMVRFIGLPVRAGLRAGMEVNIDRWRYDIDADVDWRKVHAHPATMALAGAYGYDVDAVSDDDLRRRYISRR